MCATARSARKRRAPRMARLRWTRRAEPMTQDTAADTTRPQTGVRRHGQFLWRFILFALPFWSAEHKWMNRGRLAVVAALTVAQVAVQAGLNAWSKRFYNALEARRLDAFFE